MYIKKYSFTVNSMVMNYFNKEKGKNRRNTEKIKREQKHLAATNLHNCMKVQLQILNCFKHPNQISIKSAQINVSYLLSHWFYRQSQITLKVLLKHIKDQFLRNKIKHVCKQYERKYSLLQRIANTDKRTQVIQSQNLGNAKSKRYMMPANT